MLFSLVYICNPFNISAPQLHVCQVLVMYKSFTNQNQVMCNLCANHAQVKCKLLASYTKVIVIGRKINYSVLDGWVFNDLPPPGQ